MAVIRVLAVLLLVFLAPRPADACSCVRPASLAAALKEADTAAFTGTLISQARDDHGNWQTTFDVQAVYRGNVDRTVTVRSGNGGLDCGKGRIGDIGTRPRNSPPRAIVPS